MGVYRNGTVYQCPLISLKSENSKHNKDIEAGINLKSNQLTNDNAMSALVGQAPKVTSD